MSRGMGMGEVEGVGGLVLDVVVDVAQGSSVFLGCLTAVFILRGDA